MISGVDMTDRSWHYQAFTAVATCEVTQKITPLLNNIQSFFSLASFTNFHRLLINNKSIIQNYKTDKYQHNWFILHLSLSRFTINFLFQIGICEMNHFISLLLSLLHPLSLFHFLSFYQISCRF